MNKFWIAAIVVVICVSAMFFLAAGFNGADMCGNDVKQIATSPDGKLKAVLFWRSCGATTGYTPQAAVMDATNTLGNQQGNIFFLEEGDVHEVRLEWTSAKKLVLHNTSSRYWIDEHPRIATKNEDVWIDVSHQK